MSWLLQSIPVTIKTTDGLKKPSSTKEKGRFYQRLIGNAIIKLVVWPWKGLLLLL